MALNDILKKYQTVQPTGEEGAPQSDKLQPAGEGPLGLDAILKKYEEPSVLSDVGQTILGLPRTGAEMLTGMGGGIFDMSSYVTGKVMKQLGWSDEEIAAKQAEWDKDRLFSNPQEVRQEFTKAADAVGVPKAVEEASRYQPQTRTGQVVQTAGLLAPTLLSGGGTLPANLVSRVGIPTAMIEGGAEVGKELGDETLGRLIGGLGSIGVPAAVNKVTRPYPAQPGRGDLARVLNREGVPVSAGQATGNERLLYRESVAGGVPAIEEQGPAFTAAATRQQGGFPANTNTLTRDAMNSELNRMGGEFDRLAAISEAPMTEPLMNELTAVVERYRENPLVGGRVERIVNDLFDNSQKQGGRITGQGYSDANSKIGDIIRNTADDAERGAMIELKNALDDAVESNLPANEQGAWRTVRSQYRDYLPIEKAKAQSSPTAARGVITPSALRTGIKGVEGAREVASGTRPLTELAEAGQGVMEKPPQSGTQPRMREELGRLIATAMTGGGVTAASLIAAGVPSSIAALIGTGVAGASSAIPAMRNAYTRSDLGQALMGRQGPAFPAGSRPHLQSIIAATEGGRGPR